MTMSVRRTGIIFSGNVPIDQLTPNRRRNLDMVKPAVMAIPNQISELRPVYMIDALGQKLAFSLDLIDSAEVSLSV